MTADTVTTGSRPASPEAEGLARSRARVVVARSAALPLCDVVALVVALRLVGPTWPAVGHAIAALTMLRLSGAHRLRICPRVSDDMPWLLLGVVAPAAVFLPSTHLTFVISAVASLITTRFLGYAVLRSARRRGILTEPTVVVGAGPLAAELADLLQDNPEFGLHPIGFVDRPPRGQACELPLLGDVAELDEIVARRGVLRIVVCCPAVSDAELVTVLRSSRPWPAQVCVVPRLHELGTTIPARYRDEIHGVPLVVLARGGAGMSVKRLFDVTVGMVLVALTAPVLGALMLALLLCHGRPVLFRQVRVGRDGRLMTITKLRTLTDSCPDTNWTVRSDARGALRRWLRATHIDELPQLWCVLRGTLSLVGPRPERPYFAAHFSRTIPGYADRLRVPGGLTGWAQVHGLYGDTSIPDRVRFDNHYIEHWSLWTDVVVLVRTVGTPLSGLRRQRRSQRRSRGVRP